MSTIDPNERAAAIPATPHAGPVTLINSFEVDPGRDGAFTELWSRTSGYFRAQPGFVSLRLHRALSPNAPYRYVNVATWASMAQFQAAHQTEEFRQLVGQPSWKEFPSSPAIYEVVTEYSAQA
jgi:heme-degrading monooxygenase HmoA